MIDQGITSLDTGAPDITYSGNEGPKSPEQEQQMLMAQLQEEYEKYVFEMEEQGIQPMSLEQFMEQALAEGQMSEGPPLPNDPTEPVNPFGPKPIGPVLPREMAAFGGIMGLDQRKQYGIGSKFKKAWNKVTSPFTKVAQKLMPKELAGISQYAAPFLGPVYGPLLMAAGQAKQKGRISPLSIAMAMAPHAKFRGGSGIGQFKPTGYGSMGSGQSLRNIFLSGEQFTPETNTAFKGPDGHLYSKPQVGYDSTPINYTSPTPAGTKPIFGEYGTKADEFLFGTPDTTEYIDRVAGPNFPEKVDSMRIGKDATAGILGAEGVVGNLYSSEGLDALKASKLAGAALGKDSQLIEAAGKGGLSKLKLGSWAIGIVSGIQAGKYADEMAAADAAEEAALAADSEASAATLAAARAWAIETFSKMSVYADGGRINKNMGGGFEGIGSMPMQGQDVSPPGMELDLRVGGFIPIGAEEKADDVKARVSKNEFVFTADAVKAAGGGSVNEGAKKMYDTMKRLESQVA